MSEQSEVCPSCGSAEFGVARNMFSTRHCKCGATWPCPPKTVEVAIPSGWFMLGGTALTDFKKGDKVFLNPATGDVSNVLPKTTKGDGE